MGGKKKGGLVCAATKVRGNLSNTHLKALSTFPSSKALEMSCISSIFSLLCAPYVTPLSSWRFWTDFHAPCLAIDSMMFSNIARLASGVENSVEGSELEDGYSGGGMS
jgi:hypothetical protein